MKHIAKALALLSLMGGTAYAQQHLAGSDTMAGLSRRIITALSLDPTLVYDGGGSGLGWTATCHARTTGQTINPSSRGQNQADIDCGHLPENDVEWTLNPVAKDGVNVIVNDQGNGDLVNIKVTDVGNLFQCRYTSWTQVPGSTNPNPAHRYARDGNSGTTDVFTNRTQGRDDTGTLVPFPSLPSGDENYWEERYPCVIAIHGDGATIQLGIITANDPQAVAYAGDPALMTGNHGLCVSDDITQDPPGDPVCASIQAIEDGSYWYNRTLYINNVHGYQIDPTFGPTGDQLTLLNAVTDANSCDFLAPLIAAENFYPAPRCYNP